MLKTKLTDLTPSSERLKQTIILISKGYSLKPEVIDGKITVYPWDSEISEWVMAAERGKTNLEFTVKVVRKLLRMPESVVDRFVASELLLIMLVARSLVSGGVLKYSAVCPHCSTVQKQANITVPDQLGKIGEKSNDYAGWDELILPSSGDVLKVKPLLVADLLAVLAAPNTDISENGLNNAASIMEVNGGRPDKARELIDYYLALHPSDVQRLQKHLKETSPALDTSIPHVCDSPKCEKPFQYNLGLHYDFFL